jgi:hypothetical protein
MGLRTDSLKLDNLTSDPSTPEDGEHWYNSTANRAKVRVNGTSEDIGLKSELDTHTGLANPHGTDLEDARTAGNTLSGDIDMNGNRIQNVGGSANSDASSRQFVLDQIASKLGGLDWQESVLDKDLSTPPGGPGVGDRYIVNPTGTGAWAGHDNEIAEWDGSVWVFSVPDNGTVAKVEDENLWYMSDGAAWSVWNLPIDHGGLLGLLDDDHTQYLLANGTRAMSGDLDMGTNDVTNVGLVDGVDVSSHNARHVRGGADEIDGDVLDVDFVPTNYTRDVSPAEVTNVEHLTAHLKGIDEALVAASLEEKAGVTLAAAFAGNPKKATVTFSTAFSDTNYTPNIVCETTANTTFSPCVESITAASFVINMGANNIAGLTAVRWHATAHGEA